MARTFRARAKHEDSRAVISKAQLKKMRKRERQNRKVGRKLQNA